MFDLFSPLLADGGTASITSVWDFCVKGGPVMIPIGICSLVALTVVIERSVSLARRRIIPADFLSGLHAVMRGRADVPAAIDYCRRSGAPVANVFLAALRRMDEPVETLERHVQEAGEREVMRMRKYMRVLSVVASVSTLLGLLGTIFGMITAFQTVAASGEALGKTELLAKGIYEALITTAAGLIVAIPVMIAYHAIAARIDRLVMEIDQMSVEFVEEFVRGRSKAVVSAATAPAAIAGSNGSPAAAPATPAREAVSSSH